MSGKRSDNKIKLSDAHAKENISLDISDNVQNGVICYKTVESLQKSTFAEVN